MGFPAARRHDRGDRAGRPACGRSRRASASSSPPRRASGRCGPSSAAPCTTTSSRLPTPAPRATSRMPCGWRWSGGSPASSSRGSTCASTRSTRATLYIDDQLRRAGHERPAQPRLPLLRHPADRTEWVLMPLPLPNLDDRRFQDLVDDAKRMVQQRCPEWTDHNVSDPGVTLIETFAYMVDTAALPAEPGARTSSTSPSSTSSACDLTPRPRPPSTSPSGSRRHRTDDVVVPAGAPRSSTLRTEQDEAIVFETVRDLVDPPAPVGECRRDPGARGRRRHAAPRAAARARASAPSRPHPSPGDALLVGPGRCGAGLRRVAALRLRGQGRRRRPRPPAPALGGVDGLGLAGCEVGERRHRRTEPCRATSSCTLPPGHVASVIGGVRGGLAAQPWSPSRSRLPALRQRTSRAVGRGIHRGARSRPCMPRR